MGKRNVVVISSSEEDEGGGGTRSLSAHRISTSRSNPVPYHPTSTAKSSKRARRRLSEYQSDCQKLELGNFDALCEDFYDGFRESRNVTGSEMRDKGGQWVEKYRPQSLAELAVQKKKAEEVKTWLKERLIFSKATIHVLASHLGAELCEWNTPTPTLWQEHMHNINSGVQYMSKLDEFENFVEKIRKYHQLPTSSTNTVSIKPSILLIDDLPLTNGKSALTRLRTCLQTLVQSTKTPTVILLTEYTKSNSRNSSGTRDWEDLQSSLEKSGAYKISFNPITENSIKKTLAKICRAEKCNVSNEQIDQIAKVSGGDIRHAITSLQYFCLTPGNGFALSFGRDETLSLFHALGKFLHNKRDTENIHLYENNVSEKFMRLPLKMEAPEKVVGQANGQARAIADFLHENVLEFVSDDAIDDAWSVAEYLCDADNLVGGFSNIYGMESVAELASSSVAVRGVLFGNSHPAKPRWHAIRSPKLWQVEQLARRNKNEIIREKNIGLLYSCDVVTMVTEYKPALRWHGDGALEALMEGCQIDDDYITEPEDGIEDDEIEDW